MASEISPSGAALERFAQSLHEIQRIIEADKLMPGHKPVFIIVAKDTESRRRIENEVLNYFAAKYGFDPTGKRLPYDVNPLQRISMFHFPPEGVVIGVLDADRLRAL